LKAIVSENDDSAIVLLFLFFQLKKVIVKELEQEEGKLIIFK